jgi:hypothetical protein
MFTSIPKSIRDKLGDQAAESLAKMLTEFENYLGESIINQSDYRFEKALTQSASNLRQDMAAMRSHLEMQIKSVEARLQVAIEKKPSEHYPLDVHFLGGPNRSPHKYFICFFPIERGVQSDERLL